MSPAGPWQGGLAQGLRYGALGMPLAFAALPLYVWLPAVYGGDWGAPLAALGAVLLAVRALDAVVDPWIGRWLDHALESGRAQRVDRLALAAGAVLAAGFVGLFHPPTRDPEGLLRWAALMLVPVSLGLSVLGVLHQAWGARLGGPAPQRARIVAWREGLALAGVLLASALPALAGIGTTTAVFVALLALGLGLLRQAPRMPPRAPVAAARAPAAGRWAPLANRAFRQLLAVFVLNGIAAAVPATLVLFFVRDRLQLPAAYEAVFLLLYFAAGAASMPAWVRAVGRWGLARCWLAGMLLAVVGFAWAAALGAGDAIAFALVCLASGVALGADLALPGAMLAGVIQRAGHARQHEGAYFGWWSLATKLNLALAAGLALPLLAWSGYTPGSRSPQALQALSLAYALLPTLLKLAAAALLWATQLRQGAAGAASGETDLETSS